MGQKNFEPCNKGEMVLVESLYQLVVLLSPSCYIFFIKLDLMVSCIPVLLTVFVFNVLFSKLHGKK